MLSQANWPSDMATAHTTSAMVMHKTVVFGKSRLSQQGCKPISEVAWMDKDNRLPCPMHVILKFHPVKNCPIQMLRFHAASPS
jgi:hypothetical protein